MIGRLGDCDRALREHEWDLRYAQANDSLQALRTHLQLQVSLYHYKDRFDRGQSAMTRSMHLLDTLRTKIRATTLRYQVSRRALTVLAPLLSKGTLWEKVLLPLEAGDVRGLSVADMGDSEGRRKLSWIWTTHGIATGIDDDERLHDCKSLSCISMFVFLETDETFIALRVEWCKSRARAMRWDEEVELLQEEMRRVLQFFEWQRAWWMEQRSRITGLPSEEAEGLVAYATRQADMRRSMHANCIARWGDTVDLLTTWKRFSADYPVGGGRVSPPSS